MQLEQKRFREEGIQDIASGRWSLSKGASIWDSMMFELTEWDYCNVVWVMLSFIHRKQNAILIYHNELIICFFPWLVKKTVFKSVQIKNVCVESKIILKVAVSLIIIWRAYFSVLTLIKRISCIKIMYIGVFSKSCWDMVFFVSGTKRHHFFVCFWLDLGLWFLTSKSFKF